MLSSFLISGCATITDEGYLETLERSAMRDRHEEFENQLLPIHERPEILRLEIEELRHAKK